MQTRFGRSLVYGPTEDTRYCAAALQTHAIAVAIAPLCLPNPPAHDPGDKKELGLCVAINAEKIQKQSNGSYPRPFNLDNHFVFIDLIILQN
jgi:hypothetical protein